MRRKRLQQRLNEDISLSLPMGVRVDSFSEKTPHEVRVSAPLAANVNDKGTAFGGSTYSLAVLCGWGLLQSLGEESFSEVHTLIYKSEVSYIHPVDDCFHAVATLDDDYWSSKKVNLQEFSKVKIPLEIELFCGDKLCLSMKAKYVMKLTV